MEEEIKKSMSMPNIKLRKGSKGGYSWDISISGEDIDEVQKEVERINENLLIKFNKKGVKK